MDCSNARPLLVDSFEVTQAEWEEWLVLQGAEAAVQQSAEFWRDRAPTLPATGMTLDEAREFASTKNMRLPTAREWVRIAVGTRTQYFPWGKRSRESVANTLELKLGSLAPVGSFESGRTSSGVYDLVGNGREWVLDDLLPGDSRSTQQAWAMGGSYLSNKRPTYWLDEGADLDNDGRLEGNTSFNAIQLNPVHRGRDVGLRLVADAETWLRAVAGSWGADRATASRLERIGASWGPASIPMLESLTAEPGAAPGLASLLRGARG